MARINTLTNFLTDVANAIRHKTGKSQAIACENFDTEIESISGGANLQIKSVTITQNTTTNITPDTGYDGLSSVSVTTNVPQQIPTITNAIELISYSNNIFQNFKNYLKNIKDNYGTYTDQPITLYSPEGYQYYVIQKRSDGTYRIVWSKYLNIASFYSNSSFKFCGIHVFEASTYVNDDLVIRSDLPYDLETFTNRILNFEINSATITNKFEGSYMPNNFYYSNTFNNIDDLINAITSLNGNITYTNWTSGYSFGAVKDTNYDFTYTNCNVMNFDTGEFLNDRIISHNETILPKS